VATATASLPQQEPQQPVLVLHRGGRGGANGVYGGGGGSGGSVVVVLVVVLPDGTRAGRQLQLVGQPVSDGRVLFFGRQQVFVRLADFRVERGLVEPSEFLRHFS